ncbi:MAG: hypothetical protein ACD_21C00113G0002 [uncultured bacterium]|nr:MAG: hypothetical protein ACD_21C00113G0002 [uncultured bacterium]
MECICLKRHHLPERLQHIAYPPPQLYCTGALELLEQPGIAVVGSRALTSYGERACSQLVQDLVNAGFVIISGLATGIDAVAHRAALACGGKTIAVLGTGLDESVLFPAQHRSLARSITQRGGLIVTEYEALVAAQRWRFPARNRIIAGLSLGVVVVEASQKSGALLTAKFALEANREVFAVPGSIFSTRSTGTNQLIKQGATLVSSAADIFAEFIGVLPVPLTLPFSTAVEAQLTITQPIQKEIVATLAEQPNTAEKLAQTLQLSATEIMVHLTELEIGGIVRKNREQNYEVSHS